MYLYGIGFRYFYKCICIGCLKYKWFVMLVCG